MREFIPDKPHLGWKIYFGFLALLTIVGLPTLLARPSLADVLSLAMSLVTLTGLFGYAWAVKVPGPRLFWRTAALLSVALILLALWQVITKAGPHASALVMKVAILTILFLTVPSTVALLRYAGLIPGRKPSRLATFISRASANRTAPKP